MSTLPEPRRFEKQVAFKAIDREARTATGAVLVPYEVDRQGDFLRPEGVAAMFNPDELEGVMHARFPDDAASTVENTIADEPVEIGGEEYPAGTWYITREYHDDDLWSLVERGILSGFSIGGEVTDGVEYSSVDELPDDVSFPDPVDPGDFDEFLEIRNGWTGEISDVDIPAVPRAVYATAKAALEKNLVDELDDRDDFIEVFSEQRGHSPDDAAALYDYLESVEKSSDLTKVEVAKALVDGDLDDGPRDGRDKNDHDMSDSNGGTAGGSNDGDAGGGDASKQLDDDDVGVLKSLVSLFKGGGSALDDVDDDDLEKAAATLGLEVEKGGQVLAKRNRDRAKAMHDASEYLLDDAGVKAPTTRTYTEDPRDKFDLTQYSETHKMTDDDITDTLDDLGQKLDDLEERLDKVDDADGGDDDGTTKSADGDDGGVDDDVAEKLGSLTEKLDDLDDRVERVAKEQADTDQIGGTGGSSDEAAKNARDTREKVWTR